MSPIDIEFSALGSQPAFGIHIPNSGDATKVMYLTPRFAGFQAGVSYTPESGSEAQDVVQFKNTTGYKDWIDGGVNYTGTFSVQNDEIAGLRAPTVRQWVQRNQQMLLTFWRKAVWWNRGYEEKFTEHFERLSS